MQGKRKLLITSYGQISSSDSAKYKQVVAISKLPGHYYYCDFKVTLLMHKGVDLLLAMAKVNVAASCCLSILFCTSVPEYYSGTSL